MYINQQTQQPYQTHSDVRKAFNQISFPKVITDEILASVGVLPVFDGGQPAHDSATQVVDEFPPVFANGRWERSYAVRAKTTEELAAHVDQIKNEIVEATQKRLDDFAKTRNYDGILSACTYATSTNATFQAEGQKAVQLRDETWQTLYNILGQVATQGRVVTGYSDVEPDLPVLTWT